MKLLIVSQHFWPEKFRINDICKGLSKKNHEIYVLTGIPNYPSGILNQKYKEDHTKFKEYYNCKIIRVPILLRGKSKFSLFLNYLSFPIIASTYGLFKIWKIKFNSILIFQTSPIFQALPGILLSKLKGIKSAMIVLDLWPEAIKGTKYNFLYSLIDLFSNFVYKNLSLILCQSRAFQRSIQNKIQEPEKVIFFPSWSDDKSSDNKSLQNLPNSYEQYSQFKILSTGAIGEPQDMESVIMLATELKKENVSAKIFMVGNGTQYELTRNLIKKNQLEAHIELLGEYELEMMAAFFDQADFAFISLRNQLAYNMTIPARMQSYTFHGKPILGMANGEVNEMINTNNLGYCAESGDYKELTKVIKKIISLKVRDNSYSLNSKRYYEENFQRDRLLSKLENFLEEI